MRQTLLPYRMTRPPVRVQRARMDNIALVPASLLPFQERYKAIARKLPTGSVLICTPAQGKQRTTLENVARYFRGNGHQVTTIPAAGVMTG